MTPSPHSCAETRRFIHWKRYAMVKKFLNLTFIISFFGTTLGPLRGDFSGVVPVIIRITPVGNPFALL